MMMIKETFIGIIPARYASTRFPGKPLAQLGGKTVIQRVYEQVCSCLKEVWVATDDERIRREVESFGGRVVMTDDDLKSGTDRCWQALTRIHDNTASVVINIQGDEPFIQHRQIQTVMDCFLHPDTQIATLVKPFPMDGGMEAVENPNSPKVVIDKNMNALFFSRSVIPYCRNKERNLWAHSHQYYKHIGLYAYRKDVLEQITQLPQSTLELAESLEQLRWLENGYRIKVGVTDTETIGIDTPEDLAKAERFLSKIEH